MITNGKKTSLSGAIFTVSAHSNRKRQPDLFDGIVLIHHMMECCPRRRQSTESVNWACLGCGVWLGCTVYEKEQTGLNLLTTIQFPGAGINYNLPEGLQLINTLLASKDLFCCIVFKIYGKPLYCDFIILFNPNTKKNAYQFAWPCSPKLVFTTSKDQIRSWLSVDFDFIGWTKKEWESESNAIEIYVEKDDSRSAKWKLSTLFQYTSRVKLLLVWTWQGDEFEKRFFISIQHDHMSCRMSWMVGSSGANKLWIGRR